MNRAAPWVCYAGHKLRNGDNIKTGNGKAGVVRFDSKGDNMLEQWIAEFQDENLLLCSAINDLKITLNEKEEVQITDKKLEMTSVRYMSEADEIAEYADSEGGPWFEYYRSKNHLRDSNGGVQ